MGAVDPHVRAVAARLHAVLFAANVDLGDPHDVRALQRAHWLIDVALQLADDLLLALEGDQQQAAGKGNE